MGQKYTNPSSYMDHEMFNFNSDYLADINLEVDDKVIRCLPERGLLRAMLYRAVLDLTDRNEKTRRNAFNWFIASGDGEQWGDYLYICNIVKIENPQRLRTSIFKSVRDKMLKLEESNQGNGKTYSIRERLLRYTNDITE